MHELKGRALGERSGRACDGVGRTRRRWHDGDSHRRGARLECFQEDAARRGDRNGRRSRAGSGLGLGDNAAAAADGHGAHAGVRHSGRERAVPRLAGRARAPRRLRRGHLFPEGATATGCSRIRPTIPSSSRPWTSVLTQVVGQLRAGGLGLAEGRRRIHQAHRATNAGRQRHLREAVHRGLDGVRASRRSSAAATSTPATSVTSRRSTRSRRSRSGCSGRTRTAGTPIRSSTRGTASRSVVKGKLPLENDFSEWGLGASPDAARRLGPLGRRDGALDQRHDHRRRDDELGHPRRLADDRGSHDHDSARHPVPARDGPGHGRDLHRIRRGRQLHAARARWAASRRCSGTSSTAEHHDRSVRSDLPAATMLLRRQGRRG